MPDDDLSLCWQAVEANATAIMSGVGNLEDLLPATLHAVELLFDFEPAEVVAKVQQSTLPTRPVVSWLVYEGGRMRRVNQARVTALADWWNENCGDQGGIIPPPPRQY
jgi:hypothetical protein